MATQWQFRRGTEGANDNFTGAQGEITIDVDNNVIRLHDGSTQGGHKIAKENNLVSLANQAINGDFSVQQRANIDSAPVSVVDNSYQIDRFISVISGITANIQRLPEYLINGKYVKTLKSIATSSASGYFGYSQRVENLHKGETLTLSVYVKSNSANARVIIYDGVTFFSSSTHSGNGSFEKLTVTCTVSASATILRLFCAVSTSALSSVAVANGNYIESTMWKLESGSVSTPFEKRLYTLEDTLCKRYYEEGFCQKYNSTGGTGYDEIEESFKVEKRVLPTLTISDGVGNANKISIISSSNGALTHNIAYGNNTLSSNALDKINIVKTVTSTSYGIFFRYKADAEL